MISNLAGIAGQAPRLPILSSFGSAFDIPQARDRYNCCIPD